MRKKDGDQPAEGAMGFLDHLDELRRRLMYSGIAIFVGFMACWIFSEQLFLFLSQPILPFLKEGEGLAFTKLADPFLLYMKVAFLASIFITSPFVITQAWFFIAPGLYKKEKRYGIPFIFFSTLFFIGGAAFGYYVAFPRVCGFLLGVGEQFRAIITIREYLATLNKILLGLGLVFEMPILVFFLARLGLITPKFMIKNLRYAVLIIFIIAAIITPTPDIPTQVLFAGPMLLLYFFSILVAKIFQKRSSDEDEDDDGDEDDPDDGEDDEGPPEVRPAEGSTPAG
jgi:sec-independent protein translocase protein TatC